MTDDPGALAVVRGEPTPAELAAVVVVLSAARAAMSAQHGPAGRPARPGSAWSSPARMLRPELRPGPGAWRASGLPR